MKNFDTWLPLYRNVKHLLFLWVIAAMISSCKGDPPPPPQEANCQIPGTNLSLWSSVVKNSMIPAGKLEMAINLSYTRTDYKGKKIKGRYSGCKKNDHFYVYSLDKNGDTLFCMLNTRTNQWEYFLKNEKYIDKYSFCQQRTQFAGEQLKLIEWEYLQDSTDQGVLTLINKGTITWDSLAICINGEFFDGASLIERQIMQHKYRWPMYEGRWSCVKLSPGDTLKINSATAVNPLRLKFDPIVNTITQIYCSGVTSCDKYFLKTDQFPLPMLMD